MERHGAEAVSEAFDEIDREARGPEADDDAGELDPPPQPSESKPRTVRRDDAADDVSTVETNAQESSPGS